MTYFPFDSNTPQMPSETGSIGILDTLPRGDHIHPESNAKADKIIGGTSGNLITIDSTGNIQDSGTTTSDFASASHNHAGVYEPVLGFTPEDSSDKGQSNGYASLDANAKVPTAQLPDTILGTLQYKGSLDASGGSYPSSPEKGDYYVVGVAGTINTIEYKVGDWAVYNGSSWDNVDNSDKVSSVAGKTGVVLLQASDISNLGNSATRDVGVSSGTVCAGDDSRLATDRTRKITVSTSPPSGGSDGDIWLQYTA